MTLYYLAHNTTIISKYFATAAAQICEAFTTGKMNYSLISSQHVVHTFQFDIKRNVEQLLIHKRLMIAI